MNPTPDTASTQRAPIWPEAHVAPVGPGRFTGTIGEHWNALQGLNGGMVAAHAVRAAEAVLADLGVASDVHLRAATFGYVSGTVAGELDIEVEVVRQGRSLVTSHVRTVQQGRTTMVGRLHHSAPWEGARYSDAPPMPARPDGTVPLTGNERARHFDRVDTQLHPTTVRFGGGDRAEWLAWSRPGHGGHFDSAWLTMFGDYLPPAVFARSTEPSRAVTIEYGIQIHQAAGAWSLADGERLTAHLHAAHSHDGFAVEDGWFYLPDGTVLATTRQTRLAG